MVENISRVVQSFETNQGPYHNVIFHFPPRNGVEYSAVIEMHPDDRQFVHISRLGGQKGEHFDNRGPQGLTKEELGKLIRENSPAGQFIRQLLTVKADVKAFNLGKTEKIQNSVAVFDWRMGFDPEL